ncbi:hypothetical protein CIW48_27045 [Methylobacterium sp. P1-11]|uniref:hypothetical protein n=1 Tax=Methylobacterium sp. P1-11 TaxID=2024616 RepID=UPI0011EF6F44|nr:hypothetical protein [Methylobacterium sp. P1-11]KAA0117863.1 hypothetical protein CIW48_27045 [Methylobacterium sp. P1-11]
MSVEALKFINENAFTFVFWVVAAVCIAKWLFGRSGWSLDDLPTSFELTVNHHHHFYPYEEQSPFEDEEEPVTQETAA